jgi:hypothetical protein
MQVRTTDGNQVKYELQASENSPLATRRQLI